MGRTISWKGLKSLMDTQDSLRDRTEKSHVFVRKGHSHGQSGQLYAQTVQQCVFICAFPLQPLWTAKGYMWRLVLTPQMLDCLGRVSLLLCHPDTVSSTSQIYLHNTNVHLNRPNMMEPSFWSGSLILLNYQQLKPFKEEKFHRGK